MNISIDLSQNEARVLHSLIKWPSLSDQAVHAQINMKKSTFSSIKSRLSDNQYFTRYYVPNFPQIGLEMMVLQHGELNRFSTYEERMRVAGETIKSFTEDFHVIEQANKALNMSVSLNYTDFIINQQKLISLFTLNNFLSKRSFNTAIFPFEMTRVYSFMDYEALIADLFGFSSDSYGNRKTIPTGPQDKVKLTRAERKVLGGLVRYPEESDTLIAKNIGVSRNTVANAKRKFLKKGICFPRVVPDLEKLGLSVLNLTYRKFNTKITREDRSEAVEKVRTLFHPHFFISSDLEGFFVSAHSNLDDFNEKNDELMRFYNEKEYLLEEPVSYQLKISDLKTIKEYDFNPIIRKVFNFDTEFNYIKNKEQNDDDDDDDDE